MNEVEKFYAVLFKCVPKVHFERGELNAYSDLSTKEVFLSIPSYSLHDGSLVFGLATHEIGHILYTPIRNMTGINKKIENLFEDIRVEKKITETYAYFSKVFPSLVKRLIADNLNSYDPSDFLLNVPFVVTRVMGTLEYTHPQLKPLLQDILKSLTPYLPNPDDLKFIEDCLKQFENQPEEVVNKFVRRFYNDQGGNEENRNSPSQSNLNSDPSENSLNTVSDSDSHTDDESTDSDNTDEPTDSSNSISANDTTNEDNNNEDNNCENSPENGNSPTGNTSSSSSELSEKASKNRKPTKEEVTEILDKIENILDRLTDESNRMLEQDPHLSQGISAIQNEVASSLIHLKGTLPTLARITTESRQNKGYVVSDRGLPFVNPVRGEIELRKKRRVERGGMRYLILVDVSSSMSDLRNLLSEILAVTTSYLENAKNKVAWIQFSNLEHTKVVKKYEQKLVTGVRVETFGGTHIQRAITIAKATGYDVCIVMTDACISDIEEISKSLTSDKFLFLFGYDYPLSVTEKFKKVFKISSRRDVLLALRQIERLCVRS